MQGKRQFSINVATIKLTCPNLTLISKLLRDIRSRYENAFISQSSILVSSENGTYFCYVNLKCDVLTEQLLDITPYAGGVRF